MKKCLNCGKDVRENAKVCPYCSKDPNVKGSAKKTTQTTKPAAKVPAKSTAKPAATTQSTKAPAKTQAKAQPAKPAAKTQAKAQPAKPAAKPVAQPVKEEKQQPVKNSKPKKSLGKVGFILSLLGFIFFILGIASYVTVYILVVVSAIWSATDVIVVFLSLWLFLALVVLGAMLALPGVILSVIGLVKKEPKKHCIMGIIFGAIVLLGCGGYGFIPHI